MFESRTAAASTTKRIRYTESDNNSGDDEDDDDDCHRIGKTPKHDSASDVREIIS